MNKEPILIIPHIEKTAGTSIKAGLLTKYSADRVIMYSCKGGFYKAGCKIFEGNEASYEEKVSRIKFSRIIRKAVGSILGNTEHKLKNVNEKIAAIHGHFTPDAIDLPEREAIYAMMFREPLERVVSQFQHYSRLNGKTVWRVSHPAGMTLEEYILDPDNQNFQTRCLGTLQLSEISIVGITEDTRRFLDRLGLIPSQALTPRLNCSPRSIVVPESLKEEFKRRNTDDYQLYEAAKSRAA